MSIWEDINRDEFFSKLHKLEEQARDQAVSRRPASSLSTSASQLKALYPDDYLESGTEQQLAQHFAFLAATSDVASSVSAASIVPANSPERLVLCVASNQGIRGGVQSRFEDLLSLLRGYASNPSKRQFKPTAEKCLDIIIGLNRDRMFGRLGSSKARKQDKIKSGVALASGLADTVEPEIARQQSKHPQAKEILRQFEHLRVMATNAECTVEDSPEERESLKNVIFAAYEATKDGTLLFKRLRAIGVPPCGQNQERRQYRQTQALANYWRISKFLVKACGRYQKWFRNVELRLVFSEPETVLHVKRFVHAEIQLLIHHEKQALGDRPRYIAASKKACFLCYHFITFHGRYCIDESHGKVFTEWTVPDVLDLSIDDRKRMVSAWRGTSEAVSAALKNAKRTRRQRIQLQQSAIHLQPDRLTTPSESTILSATHSFEDGRKKIDADLSAIATALAARASQEDSLQEQPAYSHVDRARESRQSTSPLRTPEKLQMPVLFKDDATGNGTATWSGCECHVRQNRPGYLAADHVELFVEFINDVRSNDGHPSPPSPYQKPKYSSGRCRLQTIQPETRIVNGLPRVTAEELATREVILARKDSMDDLEFVVELSGQRAVLVGLSWISEPAYEEC